MEDDLRAWTPAKPKQAAGGHYDESRLHVLHLSFNGPVYGRSSPCLQGMLWALRLQAHEQVTTGPCDRNRNLLSQHSARYDKHEGDPPVMSPAVPTGSLTRLYRNAGADVAMQRCEENRKASMTDCTTAPLVSARAPLHTLPRQSHWLLERRMLVVSESDTHNSYAKMGTDFDTLPAILWQGTCDGSQI